LIFKRVCKILKSKDKERNRCSLW